MACTGCTVINKDSKTKGCGSNNGCSSGGCNKLNTFDWLNALSIEDVEPYHIVEVSFKNGARKGFYKLPELYVYNTGDYVVVEDKGGYDIGQITLSGDLVRLQMRKKKSTEEKVQMSVSRKATDKDLGKLEDARSKDHDAMVKARVIARTLDLDMKIGDVEFRGDNRKVTFYYTAEGRVDFRELIRHYAKEFKVKIEMRQIGTRQESALIGGLGSCGRELCCSTWLTNFKSVSTSAARHQNLAINQAKLSGQCGRLKCCLNYELDTYLDALKRFPKQNEKLKLQTGTASFVKTDIFKGLMFYMFKSSNNTRGRVFSLEVEKVQEIIKLNKKGVYPLDLTEFIYSEVETEGEEIDFQTDTSDVLQLPPEKKNSKRKNSRNRKRSSRANSDRNASTGNTRRGRSANAKNKEETTDAKRKPRNNRGSNKQNATAKQNAKHPHNADDNNKKSIQRDHNKPEKTEKKDSKNHPNNKPNKKRPPRTNNRKQQKVDNKQATTTDNKTPKTDNTQTKTEQPKPKNNNRRPNNRKPKNNNNNNQTTTDNKPTTTDNAQPKTDNKKPNNRNNKRRRPPRKNNNNNNNGNNNNQNNNKNIDK